MLEKMRYYMLKIKFITVIIHTYFGVGIIYNTLNKNQGQRVGKLFLFFTRSILASCSA